MKPKSERSIISGHSFTYSSWVPDLLRRDCEVFLKMEWNMNRSLHFSVFERYFSIQVSLSSIVSPTVSISYWKG